jgi:restriction endonuclease S subunit
MVKAYLKYKYSGAPWFGDVPDHWQTPRLGAVLKERKEVNKSNEVTKILSVMRDVGVIPYEEKGNVGNKCSEDITRYKVVRPGDIVANCMNIIIGSVGISKYTGCLSPVYYVLTPRSDEDDSHFFDYVFKVKAFQRSLVRIGNGILAHRMRIPMELLKCEIVPKPPLAEQKAIAEHLDKINKMFRLYIRSKQKVIKLLDDQKQAIINRAITQGLHQNIKLKSSGIDWIGDIPEHWEVRRLKFLLKGSLKYGANEQSGNLNAGDPRYVRITDIDSDGDLRDETFCSIPENIAKDYLLQEGDILFARSGATVGKTFCYQDSWGKAAYAGYLIRASINPAIANHRFVYHYTRSSIYTHWIMSSFIRATIQNISAEKYASLWVPLPPLNEQSEIVNFIERQHAPFNVAINQMKNGVDRINEYRTRLLLDIVTGKIDVRDAKLPEIDKNGEEVLGDQEFAEDTEDSEEVVNADE